MQQFKDLLSRVLQEGEWRGNRTAPRTLGIFGHSMSFDLRKGFPLVTVKHVPFKSVIAELVGFIRGYQNACDFRILGTSIWDANANQTPDWLASPHRKGTDDLGKIYGSQWRRWRSAPCSLPTPAQPGKILGTKVGGQYYLDGGVLGGQQASPDRLSYVPEVDQLQSLVDALKNDPMSRRHIVTAWNPGELDQMALPPCHIMFQCYVSADGFLDMQMYQRSADVFLGVPFNIASYAALLATLATLCGYQSRYLHMTFGDTHLYENQIEGARECIGRESKELPTLVLGFDQRAHLDSILVSHFAVIGYNPHPAIKVDMVV